MGGLVLARGSHLMQIQNAGIGDLGALRKLEQECFGADAWPFLDLIAVLTFAGVVRLKVVEDGQMIGFAAAHGPSSDGVCWIATIGISTSHRNKGFGRALLRACESRLHADRVRLSVRPTNESAIRLYEQEGYQRAEVWQHYYNDGEAALIMEKAVHRPDA